MHHASLEAAQTLRRQSDIVQVLRQMSTEAADTLTERLAARLGVLSTTLFPALPVLRSLLASGR